MPLRPALRIVDCAAAEHMRLVAATELRFTGTDRVVHTQAIRDGESVSGLPGDLSVAAGRLLQRLASEATKHVAAW